MLTETEKLKRKQKYQEKKTLGLCKRCNNKVDIDGIYGSECLPIIKETRKKHRQKRINENKCLTCNEKPIEGQRYCRAHSEGQKRLRVKLHGDRTKKGLCKRCGDPLDGKSTWYCTRCSVLKNMDDKKSYKKKKDKGLCVICGNKALPDNIMCQLDKEKVYKANRKFYQTRRGKLLKWIYDNRRRTDGVITIEIIKEVLTQYGPYCIYCDNKLDVGVKDSHFRLTFDHIIPVIKGGTNNSDNLVPACLHHNSQKGKKDFEQFLEEHFYDTKDQIYNRISSY